MRKGFFATPLDRIGLSDSDVAALGRIGVELLSAAEHGAGRRGALLSVPLSPRACLATGAMRGRDGSWGIATVIHRPGDPSGCRDLLAEADRRGLQSPAGSGIPEGDPDPLVRYLRAVLGLPAADRGEPSLPYGLGDPIEDESASRSGYPDPCPRGWPRREGLKLGLLRTNDPPGAAAVEVLDRAAAAFVAALRKAVLGEAAGLVHAANWSDEWVDDLASPFHGEETRRNLIQAATLYPAFVPVLLRDRDVRERIERGRPFEAELASSLAFRFGLGARSGLDRGRLRRMRHVPAILCGGDIANLVRCAAALPPDGLPATADGWMRMAAAARGVLPFARHAGLDPAPLLSQLLASGMDPDLARRRLSDAGDVVMSFRNDCGRHIPPEAAGRVLFSGRSLRHVLEASDRWHAARDRGRGTGRDDPWPALFADFVASNGVSIACLTNERALAMEGAEGVDDEGMRGLGHCVGTYGPECRTGLVHVASVRSGGRRLSTLSLGFRSVTEIEMGAPPRISQHRGSANSRPPAEAEEAVSELVRVLSRGRAPSEVAGFARASSGRGRVEPDSLACGLATAWGGYLALDARDVSDEGIRRLASEAADAIRTRRLDGGPPRDEVDPEGLDDDLAFLLGHEEREAPPPAPRP